MDKEPQEFKEVRKHNACIHIDTTNLTLTHRKAYNILIWNAWSELDQNKIHTMGVWELMDMLDYHDINRLKLELEKLPTIGVTWNLFRDDGWPIDTGACSLLSGFRMVGNKFEYEFSSFFRPIIKNPSVWTKIKVEVANLFKSSYALSLYENCFRFADVGSTGYKDVDEWIEILGIPKTDYYKRFSRINEKILKPSIKEVNKLSDIKLTPYYYKKGKGGAIRQIKFQVEKKPNFRIERQMKLTNNENIYKEHIQRQVASFAPDSKPAQELEQNKYKPAHIVFSCEPSEEAKERLRGEGFKYWTDKQAWVAESLNPAKLRKLKKELGADQAQLGFPEKEENDG